MTQLCVAIFVTDEIQTARDIARAAEAGADMVELRIDELVDRDAVQSLLKTIPLPAIVTCRPKWEGGRSELGELERLALLNGAANFGASYVDLELESYRRIPNIQFRASTPRERRCGLILSSHHFRTRPPRLTSIVNELEQSAGDINKLVWSARTVRDNLEAFEILRQPIKPTIALCMGEAGLISRVLAKKFGAFLTFASLTTGDGTAAGQISIDQMKRLYRWDSIGPNTKVFGVVGSPIAHSMSPAIHNAAFDETGYDGIYLPLLVNEGYESFKAFMESFLAFAPLDLAGLSITIPHKENALRYLRETDAQIDPLAVRIGAVNTIVVDRRSDDSYVLHGLNTDYSAILDTITSAVGISREQLSGRRVAVIGAGGTGRTAVAALAHCGATVVIYNRTRDRSDALAAEFGGQGAKVVAAPIEKLCDSCCQVYINTTSVGMHPHVDASIFDNHLPTLGSDTLVFDTVYNPLKTKLLEQAESAGAKTVGGIEMFVRQAAAQFEAWTNQVAPATLMRRIVEQRLTPPS